MIELISPQNAEQHYKLDQYPYFLEFCISSEHSGKGIMSSILPKLIRQLNKHGIDNIGAVVNPDNLSAIKVLRKSGINQQSILTRSVTSITTDRYDKTKLWISR